MTTSNLREQFEVYAKRIRDGLSLNISLDLRFGSLSSELAIFYGVSQWKLSSSEEESHNNPPFRLEKAGLTATIQ